MDTGMSALKYDEKQTLGYNSYSTSRRMVLAIFCFVAYYYTENRSQDADLLFVVGIFILILSIALIFVTYLRISLTDTEIVLSNLWNNKKIRLPFSEIQSMETSVYSKYHLNNPAFNVHQDGQIKFYAAGSLAVKIALKNGENYLIGSYHPDRIIQIVKEQSK